MRPQRSLSIAVAAWAVSLVFCFGGMLAYALAEGTSQAPPTISPSDAAGNPAWRLVMGIHPKCPCTRASLIELERVLADVGTHALDCTLYVYVPGDARQGWLDTDTMRRASAIAGATLESDPGGALSDRYGIETSGGVVLYDPTGRPRYSGGITLGRNHEGDNPGSFSIRRVLAGSPAPIERGPVYGCRLRSAEAEEG